MSAISILLIRLLLAFVFLHAALHKIKNRPHFLVTLQAYQLLPVFLLPTAAITLPLIELYCGLGLLLNIIKPSVYYPSLTAACLLILYSVAIAINLLKGRTELNCGCQSYFSKATHTQQQEKISWLLVLRNIVLASLAFYLLLEAI